MAHVLNADTAVVGHKVRSESMQSRVGDIFLANGNLFVTVGCVAIDDQPMLLARPLESLRRLSSRASFL